MAKDKIQRVPRVVNYYELKFLFEEDNNFDSFFKTLTTLAKTRAKIRYQLFGDKYVFIQGIENKNDMIKAKMRCIRMDLLPELMDITTDETKEIDAKEQEGVVETTHFIIDYSDKDNIILALEYNHYGSKITDLVDYVQRIGIHKKLLDNVGFAPITKNELNKLKERIGRFSEFVVRIHKDNVPKLKKMDKKLWEAVSVSTDNFDTDYATLRLKFDFKQRSATPLIEQTVVNLINHLKKNHKEKHLFNQLYMRAEDREKNNLLAKFDLLIEKVHSDLKVQKKPKYRTLISKDMFDQMTNELKRIRF
ncbi:hypothetical protein [Marixanthomonas spongiae]|uniref:DUF4747 family protein n=1 Tax=Marixanthomonas spongiae TaxID=2174845 RepID=A0A2U0HWD2_9FLAO|nr:hypothetical protein [Marixanthomonas spongiae]PVW13164.1 hypothetical protein DDV96_13735 [Marixanthomonas spongiae]